jgi:hypothetical protein
MHWDCFRVADDTGVERLRSVLRRYGGSNLAGGHSPGRRVLRPKPRATNKFAPCEDKSERGILQPAKQMDIR